MIVETVAVREARRVAVAGLSLCVFMGWAAAQGADSAPKRTALRDLAGHRVDLSAPAHGVTALVFYSTECPISNSYSPTLAGLIESFPAKSVKWLGICVDPDLTDSEVQTHARDFNLKFQVVRDRRGTFARKIGAKVTPEAFVHRRRRPRSAITAGSTTSSPPAASATPIPPKASSSKRSRPS